jgi:Fe-S-cluster-containing hydrogenase component 2
MPLTINPSACPQNHRCPLMQMCPVGAISQNGLGLPIIDAAKCIKCGKCVKFCPMKAVQQSN